MHDAAEEGAIYASMNPTDSDGIEQRVRTNASIPVDLSDQSKVSVTIDTIGSDCAGSYKKVTVAYELPVTAPFIGFFTQDQTIPMSVDSSATILRPACP